MVKLRKPIAQPQYEEIEVCDRCGEGPLQDEGLAEYTFPLRYLGATSPMLDSRDTVFLHNQCEMNVRAGLRAAMGLKPEGL